MKYIEAIELVLRKLAGGDVTDNYQIKEEEVFMVMKSILPLLIRKDYIESYQLTLNAIDANLITTIICNVYRDDNGLQSLHRPVLSSLSSLALPRT